MNLLKLEVSNNRIFGLDILRALAIFFVVLGHSSSLLPLHLKKIIQKYTYFDGVSFFFVLSGFLIGHILIKNIEKEGIGVRSLFNFWIRRWFRTLPNFYFILTILTLIGILSDNNFSIYSIRYYLIFSQNLFTNHPSFFPEAWSLSVEEWFYLLIPIAIFTLIKILKISNKHTILLVSSALLLLVTLLRYYKFEATTINHYYEWDLLFRKQVFTRLDSLMYGVIGAYIMFYHRKLWEKFKVPLLFSGIIIILISKYVLGVFFELNTIYNCVFSFSLFSFSTLLLLPYLSSYNTVKKNKLYKSVTYISLISYSMYLINLTLVRKNIIEPLIELIDSNHFLLVLLFYLLFWFLTIILSILIYKYYEIPLMNLRDHSIFKKKFKN